MSLAIWAFADHLVRVCHRRRPVETFTESFADQGSRANVHQAHAWMDLLEELFAFGLVMKYQNLEQVIFMWQLPGT